MKKVGVLGGSFDPLHFGHLNLAFALLEAHKLDKVLFCPARVSPFKMTQRSGASPEHRLAMVNCGIAEIPEFSLWDWEIHQPGPSYTIETMIELKKRVDAALFLLLGEDQLPELHLWKNVEELFSLCTPLVASRGASKPLSAVHVLPALKELLEQGRTTIPIMEISSSTVRTRLKEKKFCGHLVPHRILNYIDLHQLYL